LAGAICLSLFSVPANAQATRTWVSGVGDDANPCSRTAPCKTFAGAISKTAPAGEINVLDPGGFGGVTITKSITISSVAFEAGVLVSGTPGITVAAGPADVVVLEGLDIEGLGTGTNGINVVSGAQVYVLRCKIHHFATTGINMASNTANARVVVTNSTIFQNGTQGTSNTGGVSVQGNGVTNIAQFLDTLIQSNPNYGVQVTGSSNFVGFTRSTVSGSAIVSVSSGVMQSIGPSNFFSTVTGTLTPIAFQ
jgi:Right handed beta helix region